MLGAKDPSSFPLDRDSSKTYLLKGTQPPITEISTFFHSLQLYPKLMAWHSVLLGTDLEQPSQVYLTHPARLPPLPHCSPHTLVCAFAHVDFFMETRSGLPSPGCLPLETPSRELAPWPCVVQLAFIAHGAQGHRSPASSACTPDKGSVSDTTG